MSFSTCVLQLDITSSIDGSTILYLYALVGLHARHTFVATSIQRWTMDGSVAISLDSFDHGS